MRVEESPDAVFSVARRVVFAAGSFDGVHLGHRSLFAAAVRLAASRGADAWALSFRPHPASVVAPGREPPLVTPGALQTEAFAGSGLSGVLFLPFTNRMAALSPSGFVRLAFGPWAACAAPDPLGAVVAGPNGRFGRGRAGSAADLAALSGGKVEGRVEPLLEIGGAPVSSSRIRAAVLAGDCALAARLLGRPYRIRERALETPSRGVGTALGAPTANVFPVSPLLPPPGVYALDAAVRGSGGAAAGRRFRAVACFGWRPTFPDARPDSPVLEIHLLGWSGDSLRGAEFDLDFLARLRDERAFSSPAELAAQIRLDCAAALSVRPPCQETDT